MMEKLYHDEKICGEILFCISLVVQKKILDRVLDSMSFGIMIDEFMNIFVTSNLVLFAFFVEESLLFCFFLGLLHIEDEKEDVYIIFEKLTRSINEYGLNFE